MKKIIAIALLVVFIYNLVGFVVVFKALQVQMRTDFSKAGNKGNRPVTSIAYSTATEAKFSKLTKTELCYEGRMYDVLSKKEENGRTVFNCVADDAETELIANIEIVLKKAFDQSGNAGTARQLCMILLGFYILPDTKPTLVIPDVKHEYATGSFQNQKSPFIGLHFPPPKMG